MPSKSAAGHPAMVQSEGVAWVYDHGGKPTID